MEDRVCPFCVPQVVESELHFLLECDKYKTLRNEMFDKLTFDPLFSNTNTSNNDKFMKLMYFYYKESIDYIIKAWKIRQAALFV